VKAASSIDLSTALSATKLRLAEVSKKKFEETPEKPERWPTVNIFKTDPGVMVSPRGKNPNFELEVSPGIFEGKKSENNVKTKPFFGSAA
jgi:hypothetical protein